MLTELILERRIDECSEAYLSPTAMTDLHMHTPRLTMPIRAVKFEQKRAVRNIKTPHRKKLTSSQEKLTPQRKKNTPHRKKGTPLRKIMTPFRKNIHLQEKKDTPALCRKN